MAVFYTKYGVAEGAWVHSPQVQCIAQTLVVEENEILATCSDSIVLLREETIDSFSTTLFEPRCFHSPNDVPAGHPSFFERKRSCANRNSNECSWSPSLGTRWYLAIRQSSWIWGLEADL